MSFSFHILLVKDVILSKPLFVLNSTLLNVGSSVKVGSIYDGKKLSSEYNIEKRCISTGIAFSVDSIVKSGSILCVSESSSEKIPSDSFYSFEQKIDVHSLEKLLTKQETSVVPESSLNSLKSISDDLESLTRKVVSIRNNHKKTIGLVIVESLKYVTEIPKQEQNKMISVLKKSEKSNIESFRTLISPLKKISLKEEEILNKFVCDELSSFFVNLKLDKMQSLLFSFLLTNSMDQVNLFKNVNEQIVQCEEQISKSNEILEGIKDINVSLSSIVDTLSGHLTPEQRKTYGSATLNQQRGMQAAAEEIDEEQKKNLSDLSKSIYQEVFSVEKVNRKTSKLIEEKKVEEKKVEEKKIGDKVETMNVSVVDDKMEKLLLEEVEKNKQLTFKLEENKKIMKSFLENKSNVVEEEKNSKVEELKTSVELLTKKLEDESSKSKEFESKLKEQNKFIESLIDPKLENEDLKTLNAQLESKNAELHTKLVSLEQSTEQSSELPSDDEINSLFSKHVNFDHKMSTSEKLKSINKSYLNLISDIKAKNKLMTTLEENYELNKKKSEETELAMKNLKEFKLESKITSIFECLLESNTSKLNILERSHNKLINIELRSKLLAEERKKVEQALADLKSVCENINLLVK